MAAQYNKPSSTMMSSSEAVVPARKGVVEFGLRREPMVLGLDLQQQHRTSDEQVDRRKHNKARMAAQRSYNAKCPIHQTSFDFQDSI
jgi:hypothetical protein